jgi:hypothetical protein
MVESRCMLGEELAMDPMEGISEAASLFWNASSVGGSISQAGRQISNSIDNASVPTGPQLERSDPGQDNERVDQLLLVCAAMWELVKEKTGITEEELINRVAILDAKDGVADGKLTQTPVKCPKCNRVVSGKHSRCLYCGNQLPVESVFKTV